MTTRQKPGDLRLEIGQLRDSQEDLGVTYYISKTVNQPFDAVVADVTARLKEQGFGLLTDIDVQATLKSKIGAEMGKYRNPRRLQSAVGTRSAENRGQTRHPTALQRYRPRDL